MKNQTPIVITIIALAAGLTFGYLVWGTHGPMRSMEQARNNDVIPEGMHRMPDGSLMHHTPEEDGMHMMEGMDHAMMTVESEREFLEGMIPHHQEAVDTAKEVLARGATTPEIRALAEAIVAAQEQEIALMKTWYQTWYGTAYVADSSAYEPMMRDLSTLRGAELDTTFLEDMIMHHMGAIMMAKSVTPHIEHQEVTDLTKAIIETQTDEIMLMRRLLTTLP